MSFIKKYAWYGSAVAASALLAVALLLVGPAGKASAAAPTAVTFAAPAEAAGLTETWTVGFTSTGAGALAAANTVTIKFPTGFTIPATPTCTTPTGFATTAATCATASNVVTLTLSAGNSLAATTAATMTIAGITNPAAGSLVATGFAVQTTADNTDANPAAAIQIWDVAISKSPTTAVPADGASTVALTVTPSNTAASNNAGSTGAAQIVTIATDLGTFTAAPAGTFRSASTLLTGSQSATADVVAAIINTKTMTVTLKAPNTGVAGTATITVKITPDSGGSAVLIGIAQVSFTAPAAAPGLVTSGSITTPSTGTVTVNSTGNATVTATFKDANGNAPISGGTTTVTTTLGVLSAPTNGSCTNQSCSGTLPSAGTFSVTLTGGGVAGSGTITFSTGGITTSAPVTVSGSTSTVTVALSRVNPGIGSAPATGSSANRVKVSFADSAGNIVAGQTATLTIVEANSGITFVDAAGTATTTVTDAAAASDATTRGGTAPTATDGVGYAYFTIPTTAVAGTVYTIKATSGTKSGTATLTVAGPVATVAITSDPASVDSAGTSTLTVMATDALGNPAQDGSSIAVAVSAGAVVNCSSTTLAGSGTCVFAAPGTAQNVNVTAVVTSGTTVKTGSAVVPVGAAATATPTTPPSSGAGTFDRTVANTGVNTAVWNGGTVDQLSSATAAAGGISVTVFVDGKATVLIPGAPAFVNAAFNAAFPDGSVPSGTIVLVVK